MGTLSNLAWLLGARPFDETAPADVHFATDNELEGAVRLIAVSATGSLDENHARDLLRLAEGHRADLGGVCVAGQRGRLITAIMPVASPGRTVLLFIPMHLPTPFHDRVLRRLVEEACQRAGAAGIRLAQVLLDVHSEPVRKMLEACSFRRLAELLYMQATIHKDFRERALPPGCRWVTYAPTTHELFARTILLTYRQSLDCPALNGVREIEDVIAGHQATGQFDPTLWFLLMGEQGPRGVVLLSPVPRSEIIELVYLGVVPEARSSGVGDAMMRRAAAVAASRSSRLSLAVDAGNLPALRLYWRHGLQAAGRRIAMLRDLRAVTVQLGPGVAAAKGENAASQP